MKKEEKGREEGEGEDTPALRVNSLDEEYYINK